MKFPKRGEGNFGKEKDSWGYLGKRQLCDEWRTAQHEIINFVRNKSRKKNISITLGIQLIKKGKNVVENQRSGRDTSSLFGGR